MALNDMATQSCTKDTCKIPIAEVEKNAFVGAEKEQQNLAWRMAFV